MATFNEYGELVQDSPNAALDQYYNNLAQGVYTPTLSDRKQQRLDSRADAKANRLDAYSQKRFEAPTINVLSSSDIRAIDGDTYKVAGRDVNTRTMGVDTYESTKDQAWLSQPANAARIVRQQQRLSKELGRPATIEDVFAAGDAQKANAKDFTHNPLPSLLQEVYLKNTGELDSHGEKANYGRDVGGLVTLGGLYTRDDGTTGSGVKEVLNTNLEQGRKDAIKYGGGAPTPMTYEEELAQIKGITGSGDGGSTGAVEGILRAGAGGVLDVASSISSAPEKLYEFLGGDYLEDDGVYSTAIKGLITTMNKGGKLIDDFNNNYVDIDKSRRDSFSKEVGKNFDDGNYVTGVISSIIHNPLGALEFGAQSYAFSKALTSKGIAKVPGLLGSATDNADEARTEFIKVNGREPDAAESGIIMTLSAISTAIDSAAASVIFNGVGANKLTEGLGTIVNTAVNKLPVPTLQKLITKPMLKVLGDMTVEGVQEGPLQEGLKQLAANQNDISKITDPEVLKAIYINGVIGAVSAPGMQAMDIGTTATGSVATVIKNGGLTKAYNTAKDNVESKYNNIASTPGDNFQDAGENTPSKATPITDSIAGLSASDAGEAVKAASKEFMTNMAASELSEDEYVAQHEDVMNDLEKAALVHRQKKVDEAVSTGNTDSLGATPEEEEAIYAAYALTDDEHAATFKTNMLKRSDPEHELYDSDIVNVMERADDIRNTYKALSGTDTTRTQVISTGMDNKRKGAKQYFKDALRAPVGSTARQEGINNLLNLSTIETNKADSLKAGINGVVEEIGSKISTIVNRANKKVPEGQPKVTTAQVWKAMVAATHAGGDHLANDHAYKEERALLNSLGIKDSDLSQVGKKTTVKYASKAYIRQNKGYSRDPGVFEVNHSGALVDYAKDESSDISAADMASINKTFVSGTSANDIVNRIENEVNTIDKAVTLINKNSKRSTTKNTSAKTPTEPQEAQTPQEGTNPSGETKKPSEASEDTKENVVVKDEDKGLTVADILSLTQEDYLAMHVDEYRAIGKRIEKLGINATKGSQERKDLAEAYKLYTQIASDIGKGKFKDTPLAGSMNATTGTTAETEDAEYSDNVKEAITSLIKNNKAILAFIKKNVPDYNEDEGCN